ncbi:spore coat putative kinase YutH [Alkalihalobacillus pseudalcaliphilus]|uniref:spore coat putative kinase YutH n=1 Tax=Alkalihalobacillus pseudalcaliphilus TaxID=79884 RepID=UPI00064DDA69|nr:spore coat protein YutH [Alkalihalobacillus pseudalcaliphilus]KMK77657.1 spore coat protein [Alkalihalobacillus pseudalcaliphilus]
MFERNIYDYYGLYCDSQCRLGFYDGFRTETDQYMLFPKQQLASTEEEMLYYSEYLRSIGDTTVLQLVPTKLNKNSGFIDGQDVYVFKIPNQEERTVLDLQNDFEYGEHLAIIHHYGKQANVNRKQFDYFGQWPNLWKRRLEQLEEWYFQVSNEGPQTTIDEMFLYTYPYYMGITENAIQYVVDANLDDRSSEYEVGTICHRRFHQQTWLPLSDRGGIVKCPSEFVFDHPCRDIAEWIRSKRIELLQQRNSELLDPFLEGYGQHEQLTSYAWRLMYARLLFPVHYFETIEDYYRSQIREERLEIGQNFGQLLDHEKENELFLQVFQEKVKLPRMSGRTPRIDWV